MIHESEELAPHLVLPALLHTVVALVVAPSFCGGAGTYCSSMPADGRFVAFALVEEISFDASSVVVRQERLTSQEMAQVNVLVRAGHAAPPLLRDAEDGPYAVNAVSLGSFGRADMTGKRRVYRKHHKRG